MKHLPCPVSGAQHNWVFEKNKMSGSLTAGRHKGFSLRGFYTCACGATKTGAPNFQAPEDAKGAKR